MIYQIIPLEMGSLVERHVFQKDNKEIKCGVVWKLGSVITATKPKFMKNYKPAVGICLKDISGASISKTYDGEKVIYFSETIDEEERNELSDIFYETSRKYSGSYENVFLDMGWQEVDVGAFLFGELDVREVQAESESYK